MKPSLLQDYISPPFPEPAPAGVYFVTLCTYERKPLLGEILRGKISPNPVGDMVLQRWQELGDKFPRLKRDHFVLTPHCLQGILIAETQNPLYRMIDWFQSITTQEYLQHLILRDWHLPSSQLWQPNHHEYAIRSPEELENIRQYLHQLNLL